MAHLIDNEVFLAFSTYATIVILKMMLMAPITAYFRFTRQDFGEEDNAKLGKTSDDKKKKIRPDPDVERVRRCHQHDIENIVPFFVIGLLYALTGPDLSTALLHFRVFVGSRICHTVAYVVPLSHSSRGISWVVGMATTLSMAYRVLGYLHL